MTPAEAEALWDALSPEQRTAAQERARARSAPGGAAVSPAEKMRERCLDAIAPLYRLDGEHGARNEGLRDAVAAIRALPCEEAEPTRETLLRVVAEARGHLASIGQLDADGNDSNPDDHITAALSALSPVVPANAEPTPEPVVCQCRAVHWLAHLTAAERVLRGPMTVSCKSFAEGGCGALPGWGCRPRAYR